MTQRKRILLFATKLGYQTRSFQDAADKLGVEIAYVTDRCGRLDDPWNDQALAVHFEVPEGAAGRVLEAQRGLAVNGVLAVGDRPTIAAAHVARGLGLAHNHPASVEACRSKMRMREALRDAGVPVPWFRSVKLQPLPEPSLLGVRYPCVLKPLSLSASQGVVRANNREEFLAGAARLKRLLDSAEVRATREPHLDEMLVEGYLEGKEVAVEALLTAGELRVLAIFDKPDPLEGPYFEESIYVTPSRLAPEEQRAIAASSIEGGARDWIVARASTRRISDKYSGRLADRNCRAADRRVVRASTPFRIAWTKTSRSGWRSFCCGMLWNCRAATRGARPTPLA